SFGLFQFSIGGIRLHPQSRSINAATTRKIMRSCGDAVIPAWSIRLPFFSAVADRGRYSLIRLARGKTLRLANHRHQQSLIEQPLGDAARIVKGYRFDHGSTAAEIIGAEAVELQLHQQRGDFRGTVEVKDKGAVEIALRFHKLPRGRTVVGEAVNFFFDQI